MRWLLAQARYRQGRLGDTVATTEDALGSARLTPAEVGRFHGFTALGFFLLERFDEADAAARKALAAGEATQDAVATLYGYYSLAAWHVALGDLEQALRFSERALVVLEGGVQPGLEVTPQMIRGYCLVGLDRFGEADDTLAAALRHTQQAGGMHRASSYVGRARLRFLDGRWDDALAEIQAGLDLPDPYDYAVALPQVAVLVAVHRGTHTPSSGETGEPDGSVGRRIFRYLVRWAAALADEARGDPRQALDLLYPAWEKPGVLPRRIIYEICPDLARMTAVTGDTGRAQELATTTEAVAARLPSPSMNGTALLCRGLADAEADLLSEAARCFRQAGRPLHEGYAYEEAGALLAEGGRTTEARAALDHALALYAGLGAAWDTERAQARLRQVGVRRGRRQALRTRPTHGWEALTETEYNVAVLVAEGLSNPEIVARMSLSRQTVQLYVSSILAKLELTSRVEVAGSAHQRKLL